jgi:hypothetical protein
MSYLNRAKDYARSQMVQKAWSIYTAGKVLDLGKRT